jgi:hypothetical protein
MGILCLSSAHASAFQLFSSLMGMSRWCFIESKSFELAMEGRSSVLHILERCRGSVRSICLGKVNMLWL